MDPNGFDSSSSSRLLEGVPWGAHVCHFHSGPVELLEVTVPFIAEGLSRDERCVWAVAPPLSVEEARNALRQVVPDLDRHEKQGSLDIRSYREFYLRNGGSFDPQAMMAGWQPFLEQTLSEGYQGLRGTGSAAWLSNDDWKAFSEYERMLDATLVGHHVKALCSYDGTALAPLELVEAASAHSLSIARRGGDFEIIPTAQGRSTTASVAGGVDEVVPEDEWRRRERANILSAMRRSRGRIYGRGGAAELLALKPSTLQSRIRAFGIRPADIEPQN